MAALGREVVNALLLGPRSEGRLIHDSPVRGDVWAAFAAAPGQPIDVLLEVQRDIPTGIVAARLARRLHRTKHSPAAFAPEAGFGISVLEGFVAARLSLDALVSAVLPFTAWSRVMEDGSNKEAIVDLLPALILEQLTAMRMTSDTNPRSGKISVPPRVARVASTFRILAAVMWARDALLLGDEVSSPAEFLRKADIRAIADLARGLAVEVLQSRPRERGKGRPSQSDSADIFAVSRNRPIELAIERSVPAIKADAVNALFSVSCERIGWGIIDSGVDGGHPAFKDLKRQGRSRVVQTFDFTRLRQVVMVDYLYNDTLVRKNAATLAAVTGQAPLAIRKDLIALARAASEGRTIDWSIAEKYIVVAAPAPPTDPHGTHVAGILGAHWTDEDFGASAPISRRGVCPDIRLYDFRVVSGSPEDTEFALIGALQYIRYFNGRNNAPRIHGANISLSIPHDVRNYACGRTPVCEEASRAVEAGVVVVVAAGNRGYQSYHLSDGGAFETYAPSSITDPGNAEAVITVGATHRSSPHTYGVSFFSSRGPTGDGRQKPDLVAPGEKIWSTIPGDTEDTMSGTSMAAPHVSGAAAMLMGRNAEFIGRAAEIKKILCTTCTDLGRERSFQGAGMLDILRAMQRV